MAGDAERPGMMLTSSTTSEDTKLKHVGMCGAVDIPHVPNG